MPAAAAEELALDAEEEETALPDSNVAACTYVRRGIRIRLGQPGQSNTVILGGVKGVRI